MAINTEKEEKGQKQSVNSGSLRPETPPVVSMPLPAPKPDPIKERYDEETTLRATQILLNELGRTQMSEDDMFRTLGINLMIASKQGSTHSVSTFLGCGVNPNFMSEDTHETALMLAAAKGHIHIATLLLDKGAAINVENDKQETPLDYARREKQVAMASFLESRGGQSGGEKMERNMEDLRRKMETSGRTASPVAAAIRHSGLPDGRPDSDMT